MKVKILFVPLVFLLFVFNARSQEEEGSGRYQRLGISISHANISSGLKDAENKWISLPAWGIDYDHWFNEKWGLGMHVDIIVEKFTVEENLGDDSVLERSFPVAPAIMGLHKFGRHHTLMFGVGAEFAKEENLFLNRLGYEYGLEVSEKWEVGFSLNYDFRWNAYDSYIFGIGVSRVFR
ncbi:hypothetical protein [Flavobacterium beibuense]|uniref:hypothetical protein n=1 Tax=Flavobacterium beibuense TaxID=657326 RepID=UPI003A954CF4